MIRRTQSVKVPQRARQHAIFKRCALAPPTIPKLAKVGLRFVAREFMWQQPSGAEHAGLQCHWLQLWFSRREPRPQFGKAQHGPNVVLVTEAAKKPFPKRLLPADLFRARIHMRRLALEPHSRRFLQQRL